MADPLRVCRVCGLEAHTHEKMEAFIKNERCKHGRENICYSCQNERRREYYQLNREKIAKAQREYFRKYRKIKPLQYALTNIKGKSKKNGLNFDLDLEYLRQLWDDCGGICSITGVLMTLRNSGHNNPYSMSIDRIVPERGYIKGNVRLVSLWYNRTRSNWGDQFVIEMCQRVIDQETHRLIKE